MYRSIATFGERWPSQNTDASRLPCCAFLQTAFITNTVMTAVSITACFILRYCLKRNNKQMDRQEVEDMETASRSDGDKETGIIPLPQKQIRYVL